MTRKRFDVYKAAAGKPELKKPTPQMRILRVVGYGAVARAVIKGSNGKKRGFIEVPWCRTDYVVCTFSALTN